MLTPGPIVITVAFIGYLVGGLPLRGGRGGGGVPPVYLSVVVPFPWFDRIQRKREGQGLSWAGETAAGSGEDAGGCACWPGRGIAEEPDAAHLPPWPPGRRGRFKIPEPAPIAVGGRRV